MKTKSAALMAASILWFAPSAGLAKSADEYLVKPGDWEGKDVTMDVAFVKPVNFKSPVPALQFFHAATLDSRGKWGGSILVVLPASEAESFAKRYGLNPEGRRTSLLRGVLRVAPARRPHPMHPRVYFVDYRGLAKETLEANKEALQLDIEDPGMGPDGPPDDAVSAGGAGDDAGLPPGRGGGRGPGRRPLR